MNRKEFAAALAVLEAGVGQSLTAEQAEVWFDVLKDLPPDALKTAVRRYLSQSEYPGLPPVGKLRKLAVEAVNGLPLTAAEAWERVRYAIRRWGFYGPAEAFRSFDDLTRRAVQAIGWETLCNSTGISIEAGQFRRIYESLAERRTQLERLPADVRPRIASRVEQPQPQVTLLAESFSLGDDAA